MSDLMDDQQLTTNNNMNIDNNSQLSAGLQGTAVPAPPVQQLPTEVYFKETALSLFTILRNVVRRWRKDMKEELKPIPPSAMTNFQFPDMSGINWKDELNKWTDGGNELNSANYPFLLDFGHVQYTQDDAKNPILKAGHYQFLHPFNSNLVKITAYHWRVLKESMRMHVNFNSTFVFVSHRPDECYRLTDPIYIKCPSAFLLPLLAFIPEDARQRFNLTQENFNIHNEKHFDLWIRAFDGILKSISPTEIILGIFEKHAKYVIVENKFQ